MLAIYKREIKNYFLSPFGYVFMGLFLLLCGIMFTSGNLIPINTEYNGTVNSFLFVSIFAIPLLTMRLLSEDRKQKTDQLLLTTPISISGIVIGKYLAALTVFTATLLITALFPLIMSLYGEIDTGIVFSAYLAFFLIGAAFIAIGLFVSASTDSQIISAVITLGILFVLFIIQEVIRIILASRDWSLTFAGLIVAGITIFVYFTTKSLLPAAITALVGAGTIVVLYQINPMYFDGLIFKFFAWFLLIARYTEFAFGTLSIAPMVYLLSFSAVFVFLTIRLLEKRRWS